MLTCSQLQNLTSWCEAGIMFTMLTIYISRLSIVTTQGLSSVLVVCVFFYLCQVISQDANRWREGQGHQRRCGTPVLSGSSVCEDGSWPCSLITPHPADTPLSETCYFSLFWADFPKSLMTHNCRGLRSPVPRRDWLLVEEWKQLGTFPSQPIKVWWHPF